MRPSKQEPGDIDYAAMVKKRLTYQSRAISRKTLSLSRRRRWVDAARCRSRGKIEKRVGGANMEVRPATHRSASGNIGNWAARADRRDIEDEFNEWLDRRRAWTISRALAAICCTVQCPFVSSWHLS